MKLYMKLNEAGDTGVRKEHGSYRFQLGWPSMTKFLRDRKIVVSDKKFAGATEIKMSAVVKYDAFTDPDISAPSVEKNKQTTVFGRVVRVCNEGLAEYGLSGKTTLYVKDITR